MEERDQAEGAAYMPPTKVGERGWHVLEITSGSEWWEWRM